MTADEANQERLTILLRTAQKNFVRIRSFIRVMDIGLQYAGAEILPAMEDAMHGIVAENEWHPPKNAFEAALNHAVSNRLKDAASAAEAAILIFGHSVLDYVTAELCRIIANVATELWDEALGDRKLRLRDFKVCGSYSVALQSVLSTHMAEVERMSLIERIRLITQKCFPGDPPLPLFESMWGGDFVLDLQRVIAIDQRRHDVIHRAEIRGKSEDFEDDLEYCELTLTYLVKIVSLRFGLLLGDGEYGPGVEKLKVKSSETNEMPSA